MEIKWFRVLVAVWLSSSIAQFATGQGFSPDLAIDRMRVPDGFVVKLVASEPEVRQPILVKFDERGRLWTIQYLQYPNPAGLKRIKVDRWSRTIYDRMPEPPPHGPRGADLITILEDIDGDGRADRTKNFVEGLNLTTGLEFGHGGVYVIQVPYLLFYPDRDRDDKPDCDPEVLLEGFGMEDSQSFANHLTWGPDGWLYGVNGSTTTSNVRGIEFQQGVWRYHPLTKEFELFCEGGGNLYGLTFDAHGNLIYSSNGGYLFFHGVQGGYYQKSFGKHGPLHNPYAYGYFSDVKKNSPVFGAPTTGGTIYLGDSYPQRFRGSFIAGNFLGHSSSWWDLKPRGSTFEATLGGTLLDSQDTWSCPTDMCQGPDGSMFIADFYDKRTAHPDPDADWDRSNGRIYKIEGRETKPVLGFDLTRLSSDQLISLLGHANGWYANQARNVLASRRDPIVIPILREMALDRTNHERAVQALWGLYVSGGFDEQTASMLLDHPGPYVRSWTVRLLGDAHEVSRAISRRLIELAATEPSVVVRSQLAATAKRLPGADGLSIVERLLDRQIDDDDPFIPWLLWWAIEEKSISSSDRVLAYFARSEAWKNNSIRVNIARLIRRYAAAGTSNGYGACERLLQNTPAAELETVLAALNEGLAERATALKGVGSGGLYESFAPVQKSSSSAVALNFEPLTPRLKELIADHWHADRVSPIRLRLAIRGEIKAAYDEVVSAVAGNNTSSDRRLALLEILDELGEDGCVPTVMKLINGEQPESVQLAALKVLGRFGSESVTSVLLASYPKMSAALRSRSRDVLFNRPDSTRALLKLVDEGQIPAADMPLDELRRISLHRDAELDALVRKHWGNIQPGTPEEKLAVMRRMNNDLRAGTGDHSRGHVLFVKHCATCHRLFDEGGSVGPDLTPANRGDRDFLLASLVDPSAVIRSQYLSYVVATRDGAVLTGIIAEQDAAGITLLDAKNQRTRIERSKIGEIKESAVSIMPENLIEQLTPQDLRDLFSYVQSQKN